MAKKTDQAQTHWKKLHNPDYLGAWALTPGEDMTAVIDYVRKEQVANSDGKFSECAVVHFKGGVKPMVLNSTNAKTIEKLFKTPYIEDWAGKPIQIYVASVKAFGDVVDALRIRPRAPVMEQVELSPSSPNWDAAIRALLEDATTIEKIKAKYTLSEESEQLLVEGSMKNAAQ